MSKYWFLVPFLTYVGLILISILEFFIMFKSINLVVSIAGFFIFFSGVGLRRSAIASLGDNWSVYSEVREGQVIQTDKIYKRLKHPYYLAVMLELVGASLIANAFFSAVLVFVVQGPLLLVRIYLEEKMLKTYFPDVYEQYAKGKLF